MLNCITRFWSRTRSAALPLEANSVGPVVISRDARVSWNRDGAVFIHARSGAVFTSNRAGAVIWQGLRDHESITQIAVRMSREQGIRHAKILQDTSEFVFELEAQGFLQRRAQC